MKTAAVLLTCTWVVVALSGVEGALRFAASYGSHMVLQRGPASAVVWGFADTLGSDVTVTVSGGKGSVTAKVVAGANGGPPTWKVKLPPVTDTTPFTITATGQDGSASLRDVLFGDVWLCSGQSNMEMPMNLGTNAQAEIAAGLKIPDIRYMDIKNGSSTQPLPDIRHFQLLWGPPTRGTLPQVSAVCFLFAKKLKETVKYPIGLIQSDVGGTAIQLWSSQDALNKCSRGLQKQGQDTHWNAMIAPLTSMTIKGALWYQGESNADQPLDYVCQFPAMIADWREKFHQASLGQTSRSLPFGFVQLAPWNNNDVDTGFPDVRWSQTAEAGTVPNPRLPNVFMAVAMDLPDFHGSPWGPIHPRDKVDIAERLVLGARNLVYGDSSVQFQGPYPSGFALDQGRRALKITYKYGPIRVQKTANFEVCCSGKCQTRRDWVAAPVTSHDAISVTVSTNGCGSQHVTGVRYAWRESPCPFKQCAVYGSQTALPAPPFRKTGGLQRTWQTFSRTRGLPDSGRLRELPWP